MNRWFTGSAAMVAAVAGLAGCANTLGGAQQDVAKDTAAANQAAQHAQQEAANAGQAAANAAQNATSAVTLTPEVKLAIVRDPVLNDPRNLVNVETRNHVVYLKGHVQDDIAKRRATEDALGVITHHQSTDTVDNELDVKGQASGAGTAANGSSTPAAATGGGTAATTTTGGAAAPVGGTPSGTATTGG